MSDKQTIIEKIRQSFGNNEYPGDAYLQGSREGCEPYAEVGPFTGKDDWGKIEPDFLDAHASALSFFSEAGFRFFLPAYLVADLQDRLKIADPLFSLVHGFYEMTVKAPIKDRLFVIKTGKSKLLNPRRYGAMTFFDYALFRLSVFTREEAAAIVAYLEYKREYAGTDLEKKQIEAALDSYWLTRAQTAPTAADLQQHLAAEREYLASILERQEREESGETRPPATCGLRENDSISSE